MGLKEAGLRGSLRNVSVGARVIPDSGMFQSPIYQFWAGAYDGSDGDSGFAYPEVLGGLSDATAIGGPIFRADQSGKAAAEYDGTDDGHDFAPDSQLPTGSDPFSWAAVCWFNNVDKTMTVASYGSTNSNESNGLTRLSDFAGERLRHFFFGNDLDSNSVVPQGEYVTVGVSYDGQDRTLYLNGSPDGSDSPGSVSVADANHSLGYWKANDRNYLDGYISEVVLSDTAESDQAFADYHTDRLG